MKYIILIISFFCLCLDANAQRLNHAGQKMVKTFSWYLYSSETDEEYDGFCFDFTFQYDSEGKLVKMTRKYRDGKDSYAEIYEKENNKITCSVLLNGKVTSDYSVIVGTYDNGVLMFHEEIYKNNDGIGEGTIHICDFRQFHTIWSRDYFIVGDTLNKDVLDYYCLEDRSDKGDVEDYGFSKMWLFYKTKEGLIVSAGSHHFDREKNERHMVFWKGNMYRTFVRDDSDTRYMQRETKYSEKLNDTNLNLAWLSLISTINSPFTYPETLVEWSRYRSKNLVESDYEGGQWEYTYDGNGNIRKIDIPMGGRGLRYVKVKMDYVY